LIEGFIENHPDINIKIFTHIIENDSIIILAELDIGNDSISVAVGAPNDQKSAWTTKTRNMATILNSSMFDCIGFSLVNDDTKLVLFTIMNVNF
jgi:hypothetical protein